MAPRASTWEESELFELQLWVVSQGVSAYLVDLPLDEPCRVAGLIHRLRIDPEAGVIEASITDGTWGLSARWPIRRPTPQLELAPGRTVVMEGIAAIDPDGRLAMDAPSFETFSFPEGHATSDG